MAHRELQLCVCVCVCVCVCRYVCIHAHTCACVCVCVYTCSQTNIVHRELPFHRSSFPSLSDAEFAEGFAKPRAIVDEFVRLHGRLRFEHGPIQVFELAAKKP